MRDKHEFVFFSISSFKHHAFLDTATLFVPVLDPDYTFPDKFLIGQIFYLYATRLHGTVQILLQYCLNEPVQIFASLSTGMAFFFNKGA